MELDWHAIGEANGLLEAYEDGWSILGVLYDDNDNICLEQKFSLNLLILPFNIKTRLTKFTLSQ